LVSTRCQRTLLRGRTRTAANEAAHRRIRALPANRYWASPLGGTIVLVTDDGSLTVDAPGTSSDVADGDEAPTGEHSAALDRLAADHEVDLIGDGEGLAVIGSASGVERFLAAAGFAESRDLALPRLRSVLSSGGAAAQVSSEIAANSGRWVKLTRESAEALSKSPLMKGSRPGVSRAISMEDGKTKMILELVRTPGALAANPALLAGVGGLMAQLAMQQTMDEITDYLAVIDAKVDDVLRNQKDAVLADMIGAGIVIDEAMIVREQVGRVSEVTWSKVQATAMTIARTQAYAVGQLGGLVEKIERTTRVGDLADVAKTIEPIVGEWLAVLARCFQLSDAMAVLELDRVLDASPDELDRHRLALQTARANRRDVISRTTDRLIARIDAAARTANMKVLLHPAASPIVVRSRNAVVSAVADLHAHLGIGRDSQAVEARRWIEAATDVRDKVFETGEDGVDAARRLGSEAVDQARAVSDRVAKEVVQRARRQRGDREAPEN